MFLPTVFKNKKCNCGTVISQENMREIGVCVKSGKFLIRFNCPECGLAGKLTFPNGDKDIVDFCRAILDEHDKKEKFELVKKSQFYREKLGCLYIPSWTDESFNNFKDALDDMDFSASDPE